MTDITVIICTFNRSSGLNKTLHSLAASVVPSSISWEVLIIDNNSTDATADVAKSFVKQQPNRFRYLLETKQGKSFALNRGIAESAGRVLAFVDDDAVVQADWLFNLSSPILEGECQGTGGRILPQGTFRPPAWFPKDHQQAQGALVIFDLGPQRSRLHTAPFGTNMAFRKFVFEKYGEFRTDLGPPPAPHRGEDSEFAGRLLAAGEEMLYLPSALVFHELPVHRMTKSYIQKWSLEKGYSDAALSSEAERYKIGGVPLYLVRRLLVWATRWLASVRPAQRFGNKLNALWIVGQIVEHRRKKSLRVPRLGDATPAAEQ
ncbi:MAG: glycosyltransferase family 2 protein [Acidobacteria bacterium]|nr:glycosyltransferase family 2 protein [Acidobacteriota bacterium]MBS1865006.1 glycosyltransferase family 2 protein [Acidobacteriota bacterium]